MKKRSFLRRFKDWKNNRWTFEKYQQAYQQGRYDEAQEWREIIRRTHLQIQQAEITQPRVSVVSKQQTQPLSVRQIAGIADLRRSLKTTKLEPYPGMVIEEVSDNDTQSMPTLTASDMIEYQNRFRNARS